jgi:NIPSNAP
MERRQFLAGSLAATALAATARARQDATAQVGTATNPEYYQLRRYNLLSGNELKLTEAYLSGALVPTLNRWGLTPVGAFKVDIGPETPTYYVLIPGASSDLLIDLEKRLPSDKDFLSAAAPFWNATASAPAFQRVEISLLAAFDGWPKITPPAAAASKGKRIFQLRTYESPSNADHVLKVEMFHSGEFDFFHNAGFHPVFFGDTLIGSRMPNLTYMLAFTDMAELEAKWNVFRADPAWKKLSADPRFASDQIVTNISNLMLSPLDCSQI